MEFIKIDQMVLAMHYVTKMSCDPGYGTLSATMKNGVTFTFKRPATPPRYIDYYKLAGSFNPANYSTPDPIVVIQSGVPIPVRMIGMLDGSYLPVAIEVGEELVNVNEIEWVDLEAKIEGETGVEIGLSDGSLLQLTGDVATTAWNDVMNVVDMIPYTGDK